MTPPRPASNAHIHLISSTTSGAVYGVPTQRYALVLTLEHPCWTTITSPAGGGTVFEATLSPASSPKTFDMNGSASITVAAATVSLNVVAGSRSLGGITAPVVGFTYTFVPQPA